MRQQKLEVSLVRPRRPERGRSPVPRPALLFAATVLGGWLLSGWLLVAPLRADDQRQPSVGAAGRVEQVVLPGSELVAKSVSDNDPIVVRVLGVFPHGDGFRYDLQFNGMEPGQYDLTQWLERKDGSELGELPPIAVEVRSLLPPGQIEPNELELGWIPRLGGYRNVAIGLAVIWVAVLLGLIFGGRKKALTAEAPVPHESLADLLRARIDLALQNKLDSRQHAELERMLFAFWRRRLALDSVPAPLALAKIKQHAEAGPLINQLEEWLHRPDANRDVDLASLLQPYQNLPVDTPEFSL